jgi:hypothetical protein
MKLYPLLGLVLLAAATSPASAQQMTITAECTTDATVGDGVRHDCNSDPSTGKAPSGFVFSQNQLLITVSSANGDEQPAHLAGLISSR